MVKTVFILVPDGISLRNFAYTSFYDIGIKKGYNVVFWNNTSFDLETLNFNQINIENPKLNPLTDILKASLIRIELKLFAKRLKDSIYQEYTFPLSYKTLKSVLKSLLIAWYSNVFESEKGAKKIRRRIIDLERKTNYYKRSKEILEKYKPDFVFCTSQRSILSVSPLTAAQDLGIPTACFIFSWDNIPKATTVITDDYYFVWSEYMKKELMCYQTYIKPEQIKITGTPQFENHFDASMKEPKDVFFKTHGLDANKKYICFSGDDITTSPKDELYLRDLALAVKELNNSKNQYGIVFRRCPVDFSSRYDAVLKEFNDIIMPVDPIWKKTGNGWGSFLPTKEDLKLQANIIAHTECVVNLGSSMVFDYVCYSKPCAFFRYNYLNKDNTCSKGVYVYDYVHFRSMPSKEAVIWLDNPETLSKQLEVMLNNPTQTVAKANEWFKVINEHPPQLASKRIWEQIDEILIKTIQKQTS